MSDTAHPAAFWPTDVTRQIELGETGFVLGARTLLTRAVNRSGRVTLEADRVLALLAVACGRPVREDLLIPLEAAAMYWRHGDKALANLRLVFADLPRLKHPADAYRLRLAEYLLDEGMSPRTLLKELGLDGCSTFDKYDPNQPRVPAGSGRESGRWNSVMGTFSVEEADPATGAATAPAASLDAAGLAAIDGTLASGLFATAASFSEFLAGLAAFAGNIGTGVALGAIVIPSPNNVESTGKLPGDSDLQYSFNGDEGVLLLTHETAAGTELVAVATRGHDGIFFETETGIPIARDVGGSLVFDAASLADVAPQNQTQARIDAKADTDEDQPQLCPAPSMDTAHGASASAAAYQEQISALNNPQRPLQSGMAVSLINPTTGRRVVYDDCRESDGTMIEAKGPGYARLLQYDYFNTDVFPERWTNQAGRQIAASGGRGLDWFFAEDAAVIRAKEIFGSEENLSRINVRHVPAVVK